MADDAFDALVEAAHDRAFMISGVSQLDVVTDVWKALDSAIANGTTFDDFKSAVSDRLASAWGGDDPQRVETIFRNACQLSYGRGRYEQMTDPDVLEERPFWKFLGIDDGRQSPICHECNDTCLEADSPWWATHYPPLHHDCRSDVTTLTAEQAQAMGLTDKPPSVSASAGFGKTPTTDGPDWEPDPAKYPEPLWNKFKEKADVAT
jgi:uncharacterized protein with gpF-like domain